MKRIAVFPGSFDPVTLGHEDVVRRGSGLFDELIVAIGHNTTKQTMFSLEQRLVWLRGAFEDLSNVKVEVYEGLTIDFCEKKNARFLLRGLRNGVDFDYEAAIAGMNKVLSPQVETVTLFTRPDLASIQSSIVREIIKNNGDISAFVPKTVVVYH